MSDFFISYAREDQAFVRRLYDALIREKRETWVDWQGIAPTAEWLQEIFAALESTDTFVFVISPSSVASRVCRRELAHAVEQSKRLIPVVWRDAPDGSVPDTLARLNWIFLREEDDFEAGLRQLLSAFDTDLGWVREHTRLLVRANEWERKNRDDSLLLRGQDLLAAERWLAAGATQKGLVPTPVQAQYVTASRRGASRRQRIMLAAVACAAVLSIALAIWALAERKTAQVNERREIKQKGIARRNERKALAETERANKNANLAEQQRKAAVTAQQRAEASEHEAVAQRDEAIRQKRAAQARQLASRAQFLQGSDPVLAQKAALLAAESLKRMPSLEADQVLRATLGLLPGRITALRHEGIVDPYAMASRGNFLAVGDHTGVLRVFDLEAMREVRSLQFVPGIEQVAISRSGEVIAAWVEHGGVKVWDTRANRELAFDCRAHSLEFSNNDSQLAIVCDDGVQVVDTTTWTPPQRLETEGEPVAVAWSPDGQRIAALNDEADIQVWDREGQPVATIKGQDAEAMTRWSACCQGLIAFSADGEYLVSTNVEENGLRVLRTEDWQTYAVLPHEAPINVFAFTASTLEYSGHLLATGSQDGSLRVWDLRSREVVTTMSHAAEITHVELIGQDFTSNRPVIVSASTDRTARVWDAENGTELARASHVGPVLWARLLKERLATAEQYSSISFWNRNVQGMPFRLRKDRSEPTVAACAHAGRKVLALAYATGAVSLTLDARERQRFFFKTGNGHSLTFDPQCRWIALGGPEGLEVHDVVSGDPVHKEKENFADTALAFSPSGRYLAANRLEASELWATGTWTRVGLPEDCRATELAFSPDERYVGFRCGKAYVLQDLATRREAARRAVEADELRFAPGGRVLLALAEGRISTLSLPRLAPIATLDLPGSVWEHTSVLSPDGQTLAVAGPLQVTLWRLPGLQQIATYELPRNFSMERRLAFSPNGRQLIAQASGRLLVFRVKPWGLREELTHEGSIQAVTFDRENRWLAAIVREALPEREAQYSIRVWEIASGNEVARVPMDRRAENVLFSPDRRYLLADQAYLFDPPSLIAEACSRLTRNLTRHEWDREIREPVYSPTCAGLGLPARATPDWEQ